VNAIRFLLVLCAFFFSSVAFSGAQDFDFEFGDWSVHHRAKRATGEWYEFEGTAKARPILGGLGIVEDCLFHRPGGDLRGVALRSYDPATEQWAIWWIDGWSQITPKSARWEQAFSYEAGKTWDTNWVMEFRRTSG
jgi:hypothetical protein